MNKQLALDFDAPAGDLRVAAHDDCVGYWQPQPANGYAEVILSPQNIDTVHRFSMGRQLLPSMSAVPLPEST